MGGVLINKQGKVWVYLAHPYGDSPVKNFSKASYICRQLATKYPQYIIFSPIHATSYMKEPEDRELGLEYCKSYLESGMFDQLWLCPGWQDSKGCVWEKSIAEQMGIKVVEL